jgi:hypothetical protein
MSAAKLAHDKPEIGFASACAVLETALSGSTRRQIVAGAAQSRSDDSLRRLREAMRSHRFRSGAGRVDLAGIVESFDRRTRKDGFHVLQDWDGKADKLNEETIPVDVLDFMIGRSHPEKSAPKILAILLDYYFFYVLALLSLRVWDTDGGGADENVERLTELLRLLHGPDGSGQKFVENAETLIPIATSHFEPDVRAFDLLLGKVRTLNEPHRLRLALAYAPILGSHLRFGFEATYGRDVVAMRKDNAPDYPWLSFALVNLMSAYSRLRADSIEGEERERIVEALLNGLSPDPRAFVGEAPAPLVGTEAERERSLFSELFSRNREPLLAEFERHRPSEAEGDYFPLAFYFNFSHNVLKGMVVDSLLRGEPSDLTLNDLLTGVPHPSETGTRRRALAETLMGYAQSSPDRIRGRLVPAILYHPRSGRRAFLEALRRIQPPP